VQILQLLEFGICNLVLTWDLVLGFRISSTKPQILNPKQYQILNLKTQNALCKFCSYWNLGFGIWCLLGFSAWDLGFQALSPKSKS
jgi:hypothetical protein